MIYSEMIRQFTQKEVGNKCKHGLEKDSCSFCNGSNMEQVKKVKEEVVNNEFLAQYEKMKEQYKNFQDIWTEEEFLVVYINLKDTIGSKFEKRSIYQSAVELSRTTGAINWAKEHLFSQKVYHRGKTVVEFRKLFGLDKE